MDEPKVPRDGDSAEKSEKHQRRKSAKPKAKTARPKGKKAANHSRNSKRQTPPVDGNQESALKDWIPVIKEISIEVVKVVVPIVAGAVMGKVLADKDKSGT
jgi:hypothetical protein